MSTLSSASSLAEVQAAYDDNASYEEDGSVAKALAFISACRILIRRMPQMSAKDRASLTLSPQLVAEAMEAARLWLAMRGDSGNGAGGNRHFSFENFRGTQSTPAIEGNGTSGI